MSKLLVISLDALSYERLSLLRDYPNMSRFLSRASLVGDVSSIFLSNTYPVHASISTGRHPKHHGIISNTEPNLRAKPDWLCNSSLIKSKTIWQAAKERGLTTAAVLWPVTAFDKDINYNIPEIMAKEGQNQVLLSLRAGSFLPTLGAFLRHRKRFNGASQPELDDFSSHAAEDIVRKHKPNLTLLHLTCYDTFCHYAGMDAISLAPALESLDASLGRMLSAIDDNTSVIVFSDHAQIAVDRCVNPNELLEGIGLLKMDADGNITERECFFENCGGSAFFHAEKANKQIIEQAKYIIQGFDGFYRFLSREEMDVCGRARLAFGIAAKPGYCFEDSYKTGLYKANHGYPLEGGYDNYTVFYAISGKRYKQGYETSGGSLLDLSELISYELGLWLETDGKLKTEILAEG